MNTNANSNTQVRGFLTLVYALYIAALVLTGPAIVVVDGSIQNPPVREGQPWPNLPTLP